MSGMTQAQMFSRRAGKPLLLVGAALLALALALAGVKIADTGALTWALLVVPLILAVGFALGLASPPTALFILIASIAIERANMSLSADGAIRLRVDELLGPAMALGFLLRALSAQTLKSTLRRASASRR